MSKSFRRLADLSRRNEARGGHRPRHCTDQPTLLALNDPVPQRERSLRLVLWIVVALLMIAWGKCLFARFEISAPPSDPFGFSLRVYNRSFLRTPTIRFTSIAKEKALFVLEVQSAYTQRARLVTSGSTLACRTLFRSKSGEPISSPLPAAHSRGGFVSIEILLHGQKHGPRSAGDFEQVADILSCSVDGFARNESDVDRTAWINRASYAMMFSRMSEAADEMSPGREKEVNRCLGPSPAIPRKATLSAVTSYFVQMHRGSGAYESCLKRMQFKDAVTLGFDFTALENATSMLILGGTAMKARDEVPMTLINRISVARASALREGDQLEVRWQDARAKADHDRQILIIGTFFGMAGGAFMFLIGEVYNLAAASLRTKQGL